MEAFILRFRWELSTIVLERGPFPSPIPSRSFYFSVKGEQLLLSVPGSLVHYCYEEYIALFLAIVIMTDDRYSDGDAVQTIRLVLCHELDVAYSYSTLCQSHGTTKVAARSIIMIRIIKKCFLNLNLISKADSSALSITTRALVGCAPDGYPCCEAAALITYTRLWCPVDHSGVFGSPCRIPRIQRTKKILLFQLL